MQQQFNLEIDPFARTFAETRRFLPTELLRPQRQRHNKTASQHQPRSVVRVVSSRYGLHDNSAVLVSTISGGGGAVHDVALPSITETQPPFLLDVLVDELAASEFVVVVEDDKNDGAVVWILVAAFLAGTVPVYVGRSLPTLFNAQAIVRCSDFSSVRECGRGALLFDAWSQVPVVNTTEFERVFSWHPDVVDRMENGTQVPMHEQLKEMLRTGVW